MCGNISPRKVDRSSNINEPEDYHKLNGNSVEATDANTSKLQNCEKRDGCEHAKIRYVHHTQCMETWTKKYKYPQRLKFETRNAKSVMGMASQMV